MSTSYLDQMLDPVTEAFTPEIARAIVNLRADPQLEADIQVLRQKGNEGTLTSEEDDRYKEFVKALDVVSIIQAKARRFLAQHRG